MSESIHRYEARVDWQGPEPAAFLKRQYSRAHQWHFDGGLTVPASSSSQIVRLPWSDAEAVDPEEAFVAAIASCHMLFFLDFAARAGFAVARYDDAAYGEMGKGPDGRVQMLGVTLQPSLEWAGEPPNEAQIAELHHQAHEACFLANSVRCPVTVSSGGQPSVGE